MKNSITRVLLSDVTALRVVIGICAILLSVGFMFGDSTHGTYDLMFKYMPICGWATMFMVYGILKIVVASCRHVPKLFLWFVVLFGLDLWLFTTVSFLSNSKSLLETEEFLILFLFVTELWVGASTIAHHDD